jgi:WD40 repeat protein
VWDEESGQLHRELQGASASLEVLITFISADGQQARLVAGWSDSSVLVYDPEAGSLLHHLEGHTCNITGLACIASSFAAPHHPRLVSAAYYGGAKVWDGETGELLAELEAHQGGVTSVAVWTQHEEGRDLIATASQNGGLKIWDGEAFTLLQNLHVGGMGEHILPYKSAEGPAHLLVASEERVGIQVWDPEEGRLLHHGINRGCTLEDCHLFESAQGRHLLAIVGLVSRHPRHPGPGDELRAFLDVWDLGEAPPRAQPLRPAHKHG